MWCGAIMKRGTMTPLSRLLLLSLLMGGAHWESAIGAIVVDRWDMVTGVVDSPGQEFDFAEVVENPFEATHDVLYASSHAHTDFDFTWTGTTGAFDLQVKHAAAGVDPSLLEAVSSGYMDIAVTTDTLLDMNYSIGYNLPRTLTTFDVTFAVGFYDENDNYTGLFGRGCHADTLLQSPVEGTCSADGEVLLPAGMTYRINYMARNNTFGPIGGLATDSGDLQFTLQKVPEPTGLGAILLMMMVRRRNRRIS